jgi:hypothetical protein
MKFPRNRCVLPLANSICKWAKILKASSLFFFRLFHRIYVQRPPSFESIYSKGDKIINSNRTNLNFHLFLLLVGFFTLVLCGR